MMPYLVPVFHLFAMKLDIKERTREPGELVQLDLSTKKLGVSFARFSD